MIYELVSSDDPILHEPVKPFVFGGDIDPLELSSNLFETMAAKGGIGLSANQVGINTSVFVIGFDTVNISVFNPEITHIMGKEILMPEGCLSFPGMFLYVKRTGSIRAKFQDATGKYHDEVYTGMTARVFLHEYDHMMGITMNKRVSELKWALAKKRKEKMNRRILK